MKNKIKNLFWEMAPVSIMLIGFFFGHFQPVLAKEAVIENTLKSQKSLMVTIYNQNFALVREQRQVNVGPEKRQFLLFEDVPVQIEPDTVFIQTENQELSILEQKFEYDLITSEKLLEFYVGKKVKILDKNAQTGEKSILEAELISYTNNQPIYRIGGEVYLGYPGTVIVPDVPDYLTPQPTLRWLVENKSAKAYEQLITVSYLTRGINWKVDYLLYLTPDDKEGDFQSWATIENQSGALFKDAQLKLVAGDVQRLEQEARVVRRMKAESLSEDESSFREEPMSEYHLYSLPRTATLKDQQTTQLPFLKAHHVAIQKEYLFWMEGILNRRQGEFPDTPQPVRVYVKMTNQKEKGLGFPLPQGSIKVYQKDAGGALQFIGEDQLNHTPEGEIVRLQVGHAFDVVGTAKQIEWEKVSAQVFESSWQVNLRNQKDKKTLIQVVMPLRGEWQVLRSSHPYKRLEAGLVQFSIQIEPKSEEALSFRIRTQY